MNAGQYIIRHYANIVGWLFYIYDILNSEHRQTTL